MSKFETETTIETAIGLVVIVVGSFMFPIGYKELKNAQDSLN